MLHPTHDPWPHAVTTRPMCWTLLHIVDNGRFRACVMQGACSNTTDDCMIYGNGGNGISCRPCALSDGPINWMLAWMICCSVCIGMAENVQWNLNVILTMVQENLFTFSPVWIRMCVLRLPGCVNDFSQIEHWNGCNLKPKYETWFDTKALIPLMMWKVILTFSPVWSFMCCTNSLAWRKAFRQMEHW